jgi:hypothetical protein
LTPRAFIPTECCKVTQPQTRIVWPGSDKIGQMQRPLRPSAVIIAGGKGVSRKNPRRL